MPATRKRKRSYTEKDLKKLFGADYRTPSDAELLQSPMVTLDEVFSGLVKKYPPRKKVTLHSQELGRVRRELQKIYGQLSRIEKRLINL